MSFCLETSFPAGIVKSGGILAQKTHFNARCKEGEAVGTFTCISNVPLTHLPLCFLQTWSELGLLPLNGGTPLFQHLFVLQQRGEVFL